MAKKQSKIVVDKTIADDYAEFAILAAIHARIAALATAEMKKIEQELLPDARRGNLVIGNTVVRYKRKTITSVSYAELYRQALKIAPPEVVQDLDAYRDSIQKRHKHEIVEIIDPRIHKATGGLTHLSLQELLDTLKLYE